MKSIHQPLLEEIKHYFLVENHTQEQTARNFDLPLTEFREVILKYNLDKSNYKNNMSAGEIHPGIIYDIPDEEIETYREFWEHPPENLNAVKRYLENTDIVINADNKNEQAMDIYEIRKTATKKVPD